MKQEPRNVAQRLDLALAAAPREAQTNMDRPSRTPSSRRSGQRRGEDRAPPHSRRRTACGRHRGRSALVGGATCPAPTARRTGSLDPSSTGWVGRRVGGRGDDRARPLLPGYRRVTVMGDPLWTLSCASPSSWRGPSGFAGWRRHWSIGYAPIDRGTLDLLHRATLHALPSPR
jgi:hypothetical protein